MPLADVPTKAYRGDSLSLTVSVPDYPATDGWALTFYPVLDATTAPTGVLATASGPDFQVDIAATVTATWPVGMLHWVARVTKGVEVHTVGEGNFQVLPNPAEAGDRRSHAEKCLAAITAVIEGRMGDPIVEYEIDGVKAKKLPHDQLIKLRGYYKGIVNRQNGGAVFRRVPVRFWP